MSTPAVRQPATARDIILEVVRNMREGLEPLHYTTLPPAIYHVYLHTEDFERLRGIFPRMQAETRQALDAELEELNRASLGERLKLTRKPAPKVTAPEGGWRIEFFPLRSIKQCGGFISRQVLVRIQPERISFWKLKRTSEPPPVGSRTDLLEGCGACPLTSASSGRKHCSDAAVS